MNREEIIRMAREAGLLPNYEIYEDDLERFAALVATAEREACAKVCEQEWNDYCAEPSGYALAVKECAAAIRARGNA